MNQIAEVEEVESKSTAIINVIERAAFDPNIDVDKMERLLNMQERIMAKESESTFNAAMNQAQAGVKQVSADARNDQTRSDYATYSALDKAIRPIYISNGFSLSFGTEDSPMESCVRVICHVSHIGGYSRKYHIDMPADGKGAKGGDVMTKTHATGAATQYGMRYLLKMIFNVAIGDDDDGTAAGGATSSALEVETCWIERMENIRDLFPSINAVKEAIATGNLESGVEAMSELNEAEQKIVWSPAPTKGGILTTQERTVIKSNDWHAAKTLYYEQKNEGEKE